MIKFLMKGLIRDKHRSLFPALVVILGVMLTVLLNCWVKGIMGDMVDFNAKFLTGHVKVMSRAYAENVDQIPNDLALVDVDGLVEELRRDYPDMEWVTRIRFGGLLDVPDDAGETKAQGPAVGLAVDLLSKETKEIDRLNIQKAIVRGHMPQIPGEILIGDSFAQKLGVNPGETATLLSSTMYGSLAIQNFTVTGTVVFGVNAMDRGAMIIDISDAQMALDMQDATGEILGYLKSDMYQDQKAKRVQASFNAKYADTQDEFAPVMLRLPEQNDLASMIDYIDSVSGIVVTVFVLVMSIVLWNAGLIGGLRRYGEIGLRLAIGEFKGHVYRLMIAESLLIGIFGALLGTAVGLGISYLLQTYGINAGSFFKNATMMLPNTFRARITPEAYYLGLFPGLVSTVLGTGLSGIGIYRRKTAQLFKELEV